jgi:dTDP-glucose 4,6-dehydratase
MTILVTGGAGFIGANFILDFIGANPETVVNLDKLTYAGNPRNLDAVAGNRHHFFVHGDIGDEALLDRIFETHKPRAVVNFAAESHVDRSIAGPRDFIATNIVATFGLLQSCRRYFERLAVEDKALFRFLHISTDEVYGSLEEDDPAFRETNPYRPNSPYSASKAASDHFVRAFHHTYGLPVVTVNCSNNYGPRQFPEKLIPLTILSALAGQALPVYGDGRNIRDWLYVADHCRAIRSVLDKGRIGETYAIGGDAEKANIDVVRTICARLDALRPRADGRTYAAQIAFVADRPGHDRRYAVDHGKITRELGWTPETDFATGIEATIRWYLENRDWVEAVRSGRYRADADAAPG